jgi:hypothetical protein
MNALSMSSQVTTCLNLVRYCPLDTACRHPIGHTAGTSHAVGRTQLIPRRFWSAAVTVEAATALTTAMTMAEFTKPNLSGSPTRRTGCVKCGRRSSRRDAKHLLGSGRHPLFLAGGSGSAILPVLPDMRLYLMARIGWCPSYPWCPEWFSGSSALRVRGKRQLSAGGSVMCFICPACGCRPRRSGTRA